MDKEKEYDIDAILDRQREIADEIVRLNKEKEELDVFVRVLQRYARSDEPKLGPPRPEGTPTLFEMTESMVRRAQNNGKEGLTAKEIVEAIGQEYWPGVQPPQILPQIYQFAKKGRIGKSVDGVFFIKTVMPSHPSEVPTVESE